MQYMYVYQRLSFIIIMKLFKLSGDLGICDTEGIGTSYWMLKVCSLDIEFMRNPFVSFCIYFCCIIHMSPELHFVFDVNVV